MIVPLNSAAQPNPPASPFRALFDSFIRDFRVQNPSRKTIEVYTESALQLEAFLLERGRPLDPARIGRGDGVAWRPSCPIGACWRWTFEVMAGRIAPGAATRWRRWRPTSRTRSGA